MNWRQSVSWSSQEDPNSWNAAGGSFELPREHWWQHVLETSWASDREIVESCGPAYWMYASGVPPRG